MNRESTAKEKQLSELLGKSLIKPSSSDFDDRLMDKILSSAPPVREKSETGLFKKAWRFLWLAIVCMFVSVAVVTKYSSGYFTNLNLLNDLTFSYVLYGGMMLIVPLILYQFDALIRILFQKKSISSAPF